MSARWYDLRSWPIAVKLPLAVAVLMILVGVVLSQRVMARLAETQERHLRDMAQSYLDGLSSAVGPSILRQDTWEVFDAIERTQALHKGLRPVETVVTMVDGEVIAASDPRRHPVGSIFAPTPGAPTPERWFAFGEDPASASALRLLSYPGRVIGIIHATFDTRHLAAERRDVLATLILTNGILTLILAAAGWFLVMRMMQPVRILTAHLGAAAGAPAQPVDVAVAARTHGEFGRAFSAYNALVRSLEEREDLVKRLAEEERLGSLGRLASALAHEINNPLGGLFNALATLKSHGHLPAVRENALGLLDRGLLGIRDVVRTALALHRADAGGRDLAAADIDDLRLLIAAEARRKAVTVELTNELAGTVALPGTPVRQAILNLLLNAVAASPPGALVTLSAAVVGQHLSLTVTDRGPGLPRDAAGVLTGPSQDAPLRRGGGLGLWTTRRLVAELGGEISVDWPAAGGTLVRVGLPLARQRELSHVA
jgi:signal transduction histidine kinase